MTELLQPIAQNAAGSDALIAHLATTGSMKMPPMGDRAVYLHNKAALKKYVAAIGHAVSSSSERTQFAITRALTGSAGGYLWPRWLFLRALGLVFLSAFYSLAFQI